MSRREITARQARSIRRDILKLPSQMDLAILIGCSTSTVANWETGRSRITGYRVKLLDLLVQVKQLEMENAKLRSIIYSDGLLDEEDTQ